MAREQKKLSKQELREDPLMKSVAQSQMWLSENGKTLAIVIGALLVVVIIAVVMLNSRKQANAESLAELAQVKQTIATQPDVDVESKLEDLADTYKGTTGGAEALFTLADKKLSEGNNEDALELYERFTKEYPDVFMLTSAAYEGQATALSNMERWEEAAQLYDRVAGMKNTEHVRPIMLLEAARCWNEAGDTEKAEKRIDTLVDEYPDAAVINEAKIFKAKLDLEG